MPARLWIRMAAVIIPPLVFVLLVSKGAGRHASFSEWMFLAMWFAIPFVPIYIFVVRIAFMLTGDPIDDFMHVGRYRGPKR